MNSTSLFSRLLIFSPASYNLLLVPSSLFFISVIVFFTSDYFLNIFSLLKFSLFSSIFLSSMSILMIITLNFLYGRLLISVLFSYFSEFLFYSFV